MKKFTKTMFVLVCAFGSFAAYGETAKVNSTSTQLVAKK